MYGETRTRYQDWIGVEWASENRKTDRDGLPHWNKYEWIGDRKNGRPAGLDAAEMPEGERGLSGFRHTVPPSHWAPGH